MRLVLAAFTITVLSAAVADAAPITYTETTVATGSLGATAFTDSLVTVRFTGDTAGIVSPMPGFVANVAGVASVSVAGSASATFNAGGQSAIAFQGMSGAGIGAQSRDPSVDQGGQTYILATTGPAFATYDLSGAVGPVTGPAVFRPGLAFSTTAGDFALTAAGPVTYAAAVAAASAVPEPASLALLGAGLFGISLGNRRKVAWLRA